MRAVVKVNEEEGASGTEIREVAVPEPGPGEARIAVRAAAICGSDRHIYHWDPSVRHLIRPPRVYGHEFCGALDALGPDAGSDLREGEYVSAEMHVVCGRCPQCLAGQGHVCQRTEIIGFHRDGSFAEYVVVPSANVVPLDPDVVPLRVGAFLDALGNAVHTVQDHDLAGATVAILGYGPIGAMAAAIAEHEGADRIYVLDVSPGAIERAGEWRDAKSAGRRVTVLQTGGEATARVTERIVDETGGGVDLVLEMSGAEAAINQGLRIARMGGSMSLLGIPTRDAITIEGFAEHLIFKGLSLEAIIGRRLFSTWERMLGLLADGLDVEPLVSHEYDGLERFVEGMEAFDSSRALKVVFYPNGRGDR